MFSQDVASQVVFFFRVSNLGTSHPRCKPGDSLASKAIVVWPQVFRSIALASKVSVRLTRASVHVLFWRYAVVTPVAGFFAASFLKKNWQRSFASRVIS